MKKVKLISLLIVIAIVAVSCKKETGPEGPQGTQGPAGPAGTTGSTGTANVIYSGWKGFDAAHWKPYVEFTRNMEVYGAAAPQIDQNIINNGAVLVYLKFTNVSTPMPLPLVLGITGSGNQYLGFRLETDTIRIVFYDLEDNLDPSTFTGDSTQNAYRYIIIPGGTAGSKHMQNGQNTPPSIADLKKMSYAEVFRYFNIPL
jgi:hypothetical protein